MYSMNQTKKRETRNANLDSQVIMPKLSPPAHPIDKLIDLLPLQYTSLHLPSAPLTLTYTKPHGRQEKHLRLSLTRVHRLLLSDPFQHRLIAKYKLPQTLHHRQPLVSEVANDLAYQIFIVPIHPLIITIFHD